MAERLASDDGGAKGLAEEGVPRAFRNSLGIRDTLVFR